MSCRCRFSAPISLCSSLSTPSIDLLSARIPCTSVSRRERASTWRALRVLGVAVRRRARTRRRLTASRADGRQTSRMPFQGDHHGVIRSCAPVRQNTLHVRFTVPSEMASWTAICLLELPEPTLRIRLFTLSECIVCGMLAISEAICGGMRRLPVDRADGSNRSFRSILLSR